MLMIVKLKSDQCGGRRCYRRLNILNWLVYRGISFCVTALKSLMWRFFIGENSLDACSTLYAGGSSCEATNMYVLRTAVIPIIASV
jgi:hypothetical protein